MLPDQRTPKTLSFTFRVNARLSLSLHSTRAKPSQPSLPPTLQSKTIGVVMERQDALISCYGKSPYQSVKHYFFKVERQRPNLTMSKPAKIELLYEFFKKEAKRVHMLY